MNSLFDRLRIKISLSGIVTLVSLFPTLLYLYVANIPGMEVLARKPEIVSYGRLVFGSFQLLVFFVLGIVLILIWRPEGPAKNCKIDFVPRPPARDFLFFEKDIYKKHLSYSTYAIMERIEMPSYYQANKHIKRKEREARKRAKEEARRRKASRSAPRPFSESSESIGKMIASQRRAAGITQAKLSVAAGTTQSAIAKIEKGRHNLTVKKLEMIAGALGKKLKIEMP